MKMVTIPVIIVLLILIAVYARWFYSANVSAAKTTPVVTEIRLDAEKLFNFVQDWRSKNRLPKYQKSDYACDIASVRINEIKNNFSHSGFWEHISNKDWCINCNLGENIIKEMPPESRSLNGWVHSPEHLANLKADYTHSCIKCEGTYCVHIFSYF